MGEEGTAVFALTLEQIFEIVNCVIDNDLGNTEAETYVKAWLFELITKPHAEAGRG